MEHQVLEVTQIVQEIMPPQLLTQGIAVIEVFTVLKQDTTVSAEDVTTWLECDSDLSTSQALSDEIILHNVTGTTDDSEATLKGEGEKGRRERGKRQEEVSVNVGNFQEGTGLL